MFSKEKPEDSIALDRIAIYQPDIGFKVSIDGLHNMPSKKNFYKAIYCLAPPAPFYQDPKLTEDVQFTTMLNWDSVNLSPEFTDGFFVRN